MVSNALNTICNVCLANSVMRFEHVGSNIDSPSQPYTHYTLPLAPYQFDIMFVRCNKKTKPNNPGKNNRRTGKNDPASRSHALRI